jgi:hypothetical protein
VPLLAPFGALEVGQGTVLKLLVLPHLYKQNVLLCAEVEKQLCRDVGNFSADSLIKRGRYM